MHCFSLNRYLILVGVLFLSGMLPVAAQQRVILFGVDGLSPQGIAEANTPNIHGLMKSGSWSMHARSVMPTSSSSNWAAMIMGAPTELTGVTSNDWQPDLFTVAAACQDAPGIFPTIYSLEHLQHPTARIGIFTDWTDYVRLVEPGVVTKVYSVDEKEDDAFEHALAYLESDKPDFLFLHLDHVDNAGHANGWGSPQYIAAVEKADAMLGRLLSTLDNLKLRDSTTILLTADHGGIGRKHGGLTMNELEIPWVMSGPGIRTNYKIETTIMQYDTAATLARLLDVKPSPCWRSRAVDSAFIAAH
jgi:predicted AlkP superfamily pyrophosphatase or phosphodiesterase